MASRPNDSHLADDIPVPMLDVDRQNGPLRVEIDAAIAEVTERSPGSFLVTHDVRVEIESGDKPALVGQLLTLAVVAV